MRDCSVSMTKGVAIILMVMVHARFSHFGDAFINMFHMPLFFFMSGYCFKVSYLDNFKKFALKRIKGAYLPFVKYGLLFLLFHNVFFYLNIYNSDYGFRGDVSYLYSFVDYLKHAFRIVTTLSGVEHLLGGYWFLHSYFVAAFISFATIWIFRNKLKYTLTGGGILLIISVISSTIGLSIPYYMGSKEILGAFFIVTGFVYRQNNFHVENCPIKVIPICMVIVLLGSLYWPCAMTSLTWWKIIPYALSAIAGTFMVFSACIWISKVGILFRVLTYVGDRTLEILTWHLLSFKLVSLIIIYVYNLQIEHLAEFPVIIEYAYAGWWLPYTSIGVMMPLLIEFIQRNILSLRKQ